MTINVLDPVYGKMVEITVPDPTKSHNQIRFALREAACDPPQPSGRSASRSIASDACKDGCRLLLPGNPSSEWRCS